MATRAYRIAYDGRGYAGYQRQPTVTTVEGELFSALERLGVSSSEERKPTRYAAAGRTDAGVSALAQTIALEAPDWLTPRALNAELPADVRAWAMTPVAADFHATHDARRRTYTYHCYAPASTAPAGVREDTGSRNVEPGQPVDDDQFRAALEALSGRHDFHNLTPDDRNTVREPRLSAERDGDVLVVTVTAGGFPRELVRRLVSLAHSIGAGSRGLEQLDRVLSSEELPGHEGVAPAPPAPLVLTDVAYPGVRFERDTRAAASARECFERARIDRVVGARVSRQLGDGVG